MFVQITATSHLPQIKSGVLPSSWNKQIWRVSQNEVNGLVRDQVQSVFIINVENMVIPVLLLALLRNVYELDQIALGTDVCYLL